MLRTIISYHKETFLHLIYYFCSSLTFYIKKINRFSFFTTDFQ